MISDLFLKPLSKTEGYQALVQAVEKNIGKTAAVYRRCTSRRAN